MYVLVSFNILTSADTAIDYIYVVESKVCVFDSIYISNQIFILNNDLQ
jgi:hypothetical protein